MATTPTTKAAQKTALRAQYEASVAYGNNGTAYYMGAAEAAVEFDLPKERVLAALELAFEEYKKGM